MYVAKRRDTLYSENSRFFYLRFKFFMNLKSCFMYVSCANMILKSTKICFIILTPVTFYWILLIRPDSTECRDDTKVLTTSPRISVTSKVQMWQGAWPIGKHYKKVISRPAIYVVAVLFLSLWSLRVNR